MSKEIKKLNFTNIGDGKYELDIEELQPEPEIKKNGKSQICLWIDSEKYKLVKILAIRDESTITKIISECLDKYLESPA